MGVFMPEAGASVSTYAQHLGDVLDLDEIIKICTAFSTLINNSTHYRTFC